MPLKRKRDDDDDDEPPTKRKAQAGPSDLIVLDDEGINGAILID